MPQAALGTIGGFIAKTLTLKAVGSFFIKTALYTAASWAVGKLGKRKASVQERQAQATTLSIGEGPREAVIGLTCVGGSLIDAFNSGGQYGTDTATRVIALADHAVDALVGYYVDDRYFAFTGNGVQTGFNGKLDIEFVNATASGSVPPSRFLTMSAGSWLSSDVLAGVTHIWFSYTVDDTVWTQGHPQVKFVMRGLKVYDPRKDAALGYSGPNPHTWANRATHEFSRNATLLRYAIARGVYAEGHQGDPAYLLIGRGLSEVEAPPERIIAAANLCDEMVGDAIRYAADGIIQASDEFIAVEEWFAAAMAGVIVQRDGGVEIEPGQAKSPVLTITDGDLVVGEKAGFSPFRPDTDGGRINTVVPRYIEPAQIWKDHAGPVRRNLTDITADGGPREMTLSLMLVTNGDQADRCAEIARRLGRFEIERDCVLPPEFADLEEGDWIDWQSDRRHAGATFTYRVERWGLNEKWRNALGLRRIEASAFTDPTPATDTSQTPPVPATLTPLSLSGVDVDLVLDTAPPTLRFAWTVPVDSSIYAIRAEVRVVGQTDAAVTNTSDVNAGQMLVTNGVSAGASLEGRLTPLGTFGREVTSSAWIPVDTDNPFTPAKPTTAPTILSAAIVYPVSGAPQGSVTVANPSDDTLGFVIKWKVIGPQPAVEDRRGAVAVGSGNPTLLTGLMPANASIQLQVAFENAGGVGPFATYGGSLDTTMAAVRYPLRRSVDFPVVGTSETAATVTAHNAYMPDGSTIAIPGLAGITTGITTPGPKAHGMFWKGVSGSAGIFEAEVETGVSHLISGGWIFVGSSSTTNTAGTDFASPPTPPPGSGGSGPRYET